MIKFNDEPLFSETEKKSFPPVSQRKHKTEKNQWKMSENCISLYLNYTIFSKLIVNNLVQYAHQPNLNRNKYLHVQGSEIEKL